MGSIRFYSDSTLQFRCQKLKCCRAAFVFGVAMALGFEGLGCFGVRVSGLRILGIALQGRTSCLAGTEVARSAVDAWSARISWASVRRGLLTMATVQ